MNTHVPAGHPNGAAVSARPEFHKAVAGARAVAIFSILTLLFSVRAGFFSWNTRTARANIATSIRIAIVILALVVSCFIMRRSTDVRVFKAAVAVYSLGFVAEVWRVIEEYIDFTEYREFGGSFFFLVWGSIIGAVLFLVGAVYALRAVMEWEEPRTIVMPARERSRY